MIADFKVGLEQRNFLIVDVDKREIKNHKIIHYFHACEATKSNWFDFDNNKLHGDFKQEQERGIRANKT